MARVEVLDTTLRDGSQAAGVSFTLEDKLAIARELDRLGVDFIEGGWPGSNPKDIMFFKQVRGLTRANVTAFGSTKRAPGQPDANLDAIISSDVKYATIFGKSWILHVKEVLKVSPEENLRLISESIEYLREHGLEVIYDAEHFFDGFKENREYALATVKAAEEAGARTIVLADTNGGTLPHEVLRIVSEVRGAVSRPLGIHAHNDSGTAVANSLMAVVAGATHVQGTINGIGERCGNADLIQIIPALALKLGHEVLGGPEDLKKLKAISSYVYNILNMKENPYQPYVGAYAFTHKGGVHIDAMLKNPRTYEHIQPELVGNARNYVVTELAGRSSVLRYASELGLSLSKNDPAIAKTLQEIKEFELYGSLENADGSVKLMLLRNLGFYRDQFDVLHWQATSRLVNGGVEADAELIVRVRDNIYYERDSGVGPVHALDNALRRAITKVFSELRPVSLQNFKVSVVEGDSKGTASYVRVFIEFGDGNGTWRTSAVSKNIIEASVKALTDGYHFKLAVEALRSERSLR